MPIRQQVRAFLGERHELVLAAVDLLDAYLPRAFRCRRPTEKDHRAVGRVAGVVLDVGCHTGASLTDNHFWDVGTNFTTIPLSTFTLTGAVTVTDRVTVAPNTPSLKGIFASAPRNASSANR